MVMLVAPVAVISAGGDHNGSFSSDAANLTSTDFTGYIPISSPSDLAKIGNDPAYPLDGKYYLTNDIYFGNTDTNGDKDGNFDPIGTLDVPFTGTFDGNGHFISGINISVLMKSYDITVGVGINMGSGVGLFGYVFGAEIINLGLTNGSVSATGDVDAMLAANGGKIDGTDVTVVVGGIVGSAGDITNQSFQLTRITNCYNTCSVAALAPAGVMTENAFAGGIVGEAQYCQITNCYNTGSVTATATSGVFMCLSIAGGIAGGDSLTQISDCYNTGSVTAIATITSIQSISSINGVNPNAMAGGIVGMIGNSKVNGEVINSQIINCYNIGQIKASSTIIGASEYINNEASSIAGGITGVLVSDVASFQINNCYDTGSVTASVVSPFTAYQGAGGIIGGNMSDLAYFITNCYFLANNTFMTLNGDPVDSLSMDSFVTPVIDGNNSGTPRSGNQGTGAYTGQQMTPTLANAKNNNSIYYTGTTTVSSSTVSGWDFNNTWTIVPGTNNGYPILSALSGSYSGSSGDSGGSDSGSSGSSGSNIALYAGVVVVIVIIGGCAVFFLHRGGKI